VPRQVTAFSNPAVKAARALRDKKHRRAAGRFLAEGLRILTEARETGVLPETLFYSELSHPLLAALIEATEAAGGAAIETSADILQKISGKGNPQVALGVYRQFDTDLAMVDRDAAPLWIVGQALRDPGNLGTILRTGDAVGAGGLILIDDCADPFSSEAVRASMGAIFTQRVAAASWAGFLDWLRAGAGQLVGTGLDAQADYRDARYSAPTFLLIGNESQGLPEAYQAQCDLLVRIPMLGRADSLNAAVAAAVMAYEVLNQRRGR
jgi:TrmH family RNA methyltransferase